MFHGPWGGGLVVCWDFSMISAIQQIQQFVLLHVSIVSYQHHLERNTKKNNVPNKSCRLPFPQFVTDALGLGGSAGGAPPDNVACWDKLSK